MPLITTGNWQDALEKIAIPNFMVGFKEVPADRGMIYDVVKSDKLIETYLEFGDIGSVNEFDGDLEFEQVTQGYKMTIEAIELAKGIKIQRKFVRTDQLNVVRDLPKMLGLAARRRIASDVFHIFNEAFNTSKTTIDALQLCSSAHTSTTGGSNQSNLATTAFSAVQLETVRQAMKGFLSNTDQKFQVSPDLIIGPTELEEAIYETINSSGKVDTANNNKNFHEGKYKMLTSEWLDDSNNWFVVDSELMKMFNVWNNVDPLEFGQAETFDGLAARYRAYMFYGFGSRDWRWIYGSNVS